MTESATMTIETDDRRIVNQVMENAGKSGVFPFPMFGRVWHAQRVERDRVRPDTYRLTFVELIPVVER
jgi:hypothetical protein